MAERRDVLPRRHSQVSGRATSATASPSISLPEFPQWFDNCPPNFIPESPGSGAPTSYHSQADCATLHPWCSVWTEAVPVKVPQVPPWSWMHTGLPCRCALTLGSLSSCSPARQRFLHQPGQYLPRTSQVSSCSHTSAVGEYFLITREANPNDDVAPEIHINDVIPKLPADDVTSELPADMEDTAPQLVLLLLHRCGLPRHQLMSTH